MSAITNITGLLSDAATPFTLIGVQGSAGANLPAVYRDQSTSTVSAHQAEVRLRVGENGARTKLTPRVEVSIPTIATDANGQPYVVRRQNYTITGSISSNAPSAERKDGAAIVGAVMSSADFAAMIATGFAPN